MIKITSPLSWPSALKIVGRLSAPLAAARIISALTGFGGMLLMAQLGPEALAAGALITAAFNTIMVIVWGMMFSVGVLIGHAHGAHDPLKIGRILRASILLSICLSIPAGILMWNMPPLFLWFHQPRGEVLLAKEYFHPASFMILPSLICVCFSQFCMAINRARLVLIWTLISLPVTLLLAYALLFGHFSLPRLGVAGIAWANVIVWTGLFIWLAYYFFSHREFKQYHLLRFELAPLWPLVKRMIVLGSPISCQFGGELAAFAVVTLLMGLFGSYALAAQQIVIQIGMLVVMIPLGISQAAAVLVSQAMGAKKSFAYRRLSYAALVIGVVVMLLIALLYWIYPKVLIVLYMHGQLTVFKVRELAVALFAVMAFAQIFDAVRNIATGALRGLHDTHKPMKLNLIVVWLIGIPAGLILAFVIKLGPLGLPIGLAIGFLSGAILLTRRFVKLSSTV